MHLTGQVISPACAVFGGVVAGAAVALAIKAARRQLTPPRARHLAGTLALVFAGQVIDINVLPDTPAHLLGGFLLACWLGPACAMLGMTLILALQALLLNDGELVALGVNVTNIAVIPCLIVFPLWQTLCRRNLLSITVGSGASGLLAACACSIALLPMFRQNELLNIAATGLMEAIATAAAVFLVGCFTRRHPQTLPASER